MPTEAKPVEQPLELAYAVREITRRLPIPDESALRMLRTVMGRGGGKIAPVDAAEEIVEKFRNRLTPPKDVSKL